MNDIAWDLAIDLRTGDLVWTGANDLGSRGGDDLDKQRIHVRLFIERGEFIYDPTNGGLGSRLLDVVHLPRERAMNEVGLMVREALEPMTDIEVVSVEVKEQTDPRIVLIELSYRPLFTFGEFVKPEETLQETLILEVPV